MLANNNIILVGMMGAGKTSVGKDLAGVLQWQFVDSDDVIEQLAGTSITEFVADKGWTAFRIFEQQVLRDILGKERQVVATGGGAVLAAANRLLFAQRGTTFWLKASAMTLWRRLAEERETRPLLTTITCEDEMAALLTERLPYYAEAEYSLCSDKKTPTDLAQEIFALWQHLQQKRFSQNSARSMVRVELGERSYNIIAENGSSQNVVSYLQQIPKFDKIILVSDSSVFALYGNTMLKQLQSVCVAEAAIVPVGESSKSLKVLDELYEQAALNKLTRNSLVVALGGGVVGDLAGLLAATWQRGIGFVQLPTSLLAIVDSSVGGKNAINSQWAKNVIGTFYQPQLVLIDSDFLITLPSMEVAAGWAEIIKHGFLAGDDFIHKIIEFILAGGCWQSERGNDLLLANCRFKAEVVIADERESSGRRAILNFGHTVGHAVEYLSKGRYNHGQSVAIGMRAAMIIGRLLGITSTNLLLRLDELLQLCKLPLLAEGLSKDEVLLQLVHDKKMQAGRINWVLLTACGQPCLRNDVDESIVLQALDLICGGENDKS